MLESGDIARLHSTAITTVSLRTDFEEESALLQQIVKLERVGIQADFQCRVFRQFCHLFQNLKNIVRWLNAPHVEN